MRGSIGLVIGLAVGAGGMYLDLRRPWEHHVATTASDGPPVVIVPNLAGPGKPRPKRKRHLPGNLSNGHAPAGPDGEAEPDEPASTAPGAGDAVVALTAADRALESRGDDVALPAQTLDMTKPGGEARALDDGEITAAINNGGGAMKDCVVQAAMSTDLRATITLKLVVDGHGRITKSRLQAPHYLFEHGLLGCTQRALGRLRFPATGAPTLVTFPINLG